MPVLLSSMFSACESHLGLASVARYKQLFVNNLPAWIGVATSVGLTILHRQSCRGVWRTRRSCRTDRRTPQRIEAPIEFRYTQLP